MSDQKDVEMSEAPAGDEQQRAASTSPATTDADAAAGSSDAAAAAAKPASSSSSSAAAAAAAGSKKKKGGKKGEEVSEVDPNYPGQRFRLGELIYANYMDGAQWFEAKVLKIDRRNGLIYYYLHYQGWSDKYNDWRPYHLDSELMKHDEAGRRVYDEAKQKLKDAKDSKNSKGAKNNATAAAAAATEEPRKKSKRKVDEDDTVSDEVSVGGASGEVKLKISGYLKKQLIADWENVTRQHQLVTLPRPVSVHALLREFEESKARQEGALAIVKEVTAGLEQYFERALGTVLLYRFERPQYKQWVAKCAAESPPKPLAQVYGPEHLLRLFVKLPSLLSYVKLEPKEAVVLGSKLNEFIKWLDVKARSGSLFQAEYEAATKDYTHAVNNEHE